VGSLPRGARLVAYPTRNFATLGSLVTSLQCEERSGHFCLTPHVAMGLGLYLHRLSAVAGAWRAVSEDPFRFPADCPHRTDCHCLFAEASTAGYLRVFQHIAKFYNGLEVIPTVIVTAAVYRGLGSELRPCGLTLPRNLPAPGRRHSVYVVLRLSTLLCF
jgi:hypothetical protein